MRSTVEREAKLAAWPGFALPDLRDAAGGLEPRAMEPRQLTAVYYDTTDLRLARWGVTVRHRRGDGDGWTVKLPRASKGSTIERRELHFEGRPGAVPKAVATLLAAYVRTSPLGPVARLRTRRLGVELVDESDRRVLEVVDDEVSVYEGRHLANRFREVEVEVCAEAGNGLLEAVVATLVSAGATRTEPVPKVVRALGARATDPPELVVGALRSDASVADVVVRAVASTAVALMAHDPGIRLGDDPEDVHQARVAARTLRSNLHTFRAALDPVWTLALRTELSWLGAELGAVRDADVLAERLASGFGLLSAADAGDVEALMTHLAERRGLARSRLLAAMSSPRYLRLINELVDAAARPRLAPGVVPSIPASEAVSGADAPGPALADDPTGPAALTAETDADAAGRGPALPTVSAEGPAPIPGSTPAADVAPSLVASPWQRLAKAVHKLDDDPPDEALHELRIRAKRCRYAAEAVAEVVGGPARKMARAVAALQTVLGDHQDAVVAEDWLRTEAAAGNVPPLLAGQLVMLQRMEAAERRSQWHEVWKKASNKRLRAWMN